MALLLLIQPGRAKATDKLFPVSNGKKYGYVDQHNKVHIPFRYSYAEPFRNGLAIVSRSRYKGAIDAEGRLVIPFSRSPIKAYEGGFWVAYDNAEDLRLYNRKGKMLYSGKGVIDDDLASKGIYSSKLGIAIINSIKTEQDVSQSIVIDNRGKVLLKINSSRGHKLYFLLTPGRHDSMVPASFCFVLESGDESTRSFSILNSMGKELIHSLRSIKVTKNRIILQARDRAAMMGMDMNPLIHFGSEYEKIEEINGYDYYSLKKDGLFGIADSNMKVIIPCLYKNPLHVLDQEYFRTESEFRQYVYLNAVADTVLLCPKMLSASELRGPCALEFEVDQLTAAMRMMSYDYEYRLWRSGTFLSPLYKYLQTTGSNSLFFETDGKCGLLDSNGRLLFSGYYRTLVPPSFGLMAASVSLEQHDSNENNIKNQYFFINSRGEIPGDQCFDQVQPFLDNYALAVKDERYFIVNKNGAVAPLQYQASGTFVNGALMVKEGARFALVGSHGGLISAWFDSCSRLSLGKYSYQIIHSGNVVVHEKEELDIPLFNDSIILVHNSCKSGLLRSNGQFALYPLYKEIIPVYISGKLRFYKLIYQQGKYISEGLCDSKGNILLYPVYARVTYESNGDYFKYSSFGSELEKVLTFP